MKKFLLIIVVIVIFFTVSHVRYKANLAPLDEGKTAKQEFTIESGMSVAAVAIALEEASLIQSNTAFTKYAKKNELDRTMQAGTYLIGPAMSVPEIAAMLQKASDQQMRITIPEGYTVRDINDLLKEKGLIDADEFNNCARTCDVSQFTFLPSKTDDWLSRSGNVEGYLFPDTYYVAVQGFTVELFLNRLLTTFEQNVVNTYRSDIADSGYTLDQIITMASLVEKETRRADERAIVAGILFKRLEEGITLGVDATVRYLVNKDTAPITVTDLATDSPYNTRKFLGLPPSPIANPGVQTIESSINYESSPYYYYLHGADGVIRYGRTNDEHNANKARYL